MESLKLNELEITVTRGSPTVVRWRGLSEIITPSSVINPFFEELATTLEGEQVIVDFTELKYMNSSTVSPIIHLCNLFDRKNIQTIVRYDKSSDWQPAIFKGLIALSRLLKNLKVEPVEPVGR